MATVWRSRAAIRRRWATSTSRCTSEASRPRASPASPCARTAPACSRTSPNSCPSSTPLGPIGGWRDSSTSSRSRLPRAPVRASCPMPHSTRSSRLRPRSRKTSARRWRVGSRPRPSGRADNCSSRFTRHLPRRSPTSRLRNTCSSTSQRRRRRSRAGPAWRANCLPRVTAARGKLGVRRRGRCWQPTPGRSPPCGSHRERRGGSRATPASSRRRPAMPWTSHLPPVCCSPGGSWRARRRLRPMVRRAVWLRRRRAW